MREPAWNACQNTIQPSKLMADRLAEAGYLLSDVATDLAAYADDIEADPVRLAAAQERQSVLAGLVRKYATAGAGVDAVIAWASDGDQRLAELDNDDSRLAELAIESSRLRDSMVALAGELTAARTKAAEHFAESVTAELRDLAMPHAAVTVDVRTGTDYGSHGADDIDVLLAPHPGAPPRPLAKGASGGELSRVMLAVEVVFAGADPVPTFVFDEVDAGVGGKAAVEVGRRLARLARVAQVIVVTHLPQVAAFADRHLLGGEVRRRPGDTQRRRRPRRHRPGERAVSNARRASRVPRLPRGTPANCSLQRRGSSKTCSPLIPARHEPD